MNSSKLQTHNNNNKLQSIINIQIYLSYFLYFELNFVFSSFRDVFVNGVERSKVKKIL